MWYEKPWKWSELWSGGVSEEKYIEMFGDIDRMGSEEFVKKV